MKYSYMVHGKFTMILIRILRQQRNKTQKVVCYCIGIVSEIASCIIGIPAEMMKANHDK